MNMIETSLPLPAPAMVQFFKDKKNTKFAVDVAASLTNLRTEAAMLNYIANLKMDCTLVTDTVSVPMMLAYLTMRDRAEVNVLAKIHANILYFAKYQEVLFEEVLELFNFDSIVEIVTSNSQLIVAQLAFLNSMPLYVQTCMGGDENTVRSEHELVKNVTDEVYVGINQNLFQLFTLDMFLICFLEKSNSFDDQVYFKQHFESNMYGGKTLFGWFCVPGNQYFTLCQHVASSVISGLDRYKLLSLYTELLKLNRDARSLQYIDETIAEKGGVKSALQMTNRDIAAVNRQLRRDKKIAKRAV